MKTKITLLVLLSLLVGVTFLNLRVWGAWFQCRPDFCVDKARFACEESCRLVYNEICDDPALISSWCNGSYCYSSWVFLCGNGRYIKGYLCPEISGDCY